MWNKRKIVKKKKKKKNEKEKHLVWGILIAYWVSKRYSMIQSDLFKPVDRAQRIWLSRIYCFVINTRQRILNTVATSACGNYLIYLRLLVLQHVLTNLS